MERVRIRFAGFCMVAIAFALLLSLLQKSRAGSLDDPGPNLFQSINPGSYSPCHWWTPSVYRIRAYHRPARLYDQAQWDGGGYYGTAPDSSCKSSSPAPASQKKADEKN
jgi:hypothetical protein